MFIFHSISKQRIHKHTAAKRVDDAKKDDIKTITQADIDDNIKKFREGNFETVPDPQKLAHFK